MVFWFLKDGGEGIFVWVQVVPILEGFLVKWGCLIDFVQDVYSICFDICKVSSVPGGKTKSSSEVPLFSDSLGGKTATQAATLGWKMEENRTQN